MNFERGAACVYLAALRCFTHERNEGLMLKFADHDRIVAAWRCDHRQATLAIGISGSSDDDTWILGSCV